MIITSTHRNMNTAKDRSQPDLEIFPNTALLDVELKILVTCLRPQQHVTLACRVQEDGVRYFSNAYYISDDDGMVNVAQMPAQQGGSFTDIEPMGLIWSQVQEPGQAPGRRLVKSDITQPIITHLYVLDGFKSSNDCLEVIAQKEWLAYGTCKRIHMAEGVTRIEVREGRLVGTLFIPAGPGPFPGVIDLFGTIGGITEHRSALLASRGIASFTVCYFTPGRGEGLICDIEYFEAAIDYLLRHPAVRKPYVGVIGVSKGGEVALLTAALCHKIKACISINNIDVITLNDTTYKGKIYPIYHLDWDLIDQNQDDGIRFARLYNCITDEDREIYGIPVEKGSCDYLLIHGAEDQSVQPLAAKYIPERLHKYGKTNYTVRVYPGAGHLLEPPYSPHFYATYHGMFKKVAIWGGYAKEHAVAQKESWQEILRFFKHTLSSHLSKEPSIKSHI